MRAISIRKLVGWFGVTMIGVVFVGGFLAYLVSSFDSQTKATFDGVGRPLSAGRAVVWESVASGRIWMVRLARRAHRAPDVAQRVLKEVQRGMCEWRAVFEVGRWLRARTFTDPHANSRIPIRSESAA